MKKRLLHQKPAMLLLLAIAIASCTVPLQSEGSRGKYWHCFTSSRDQSVPIIKAWAASQPLSVGGGTYKGTIQVEGIVKDAAYSAEGLTHRWNFDLNQDNGTYAAAFRIEPDGTGLYYYFGSQGTAKPSIIAKCKKTK